MQPADFCEALRRWLSIEKPNNEGFDAELTAEHARRCTNRGTDARQHMMKGLIFNTLRSCTGSLLVKREDAGPFIDQGWVE